MRPIRISIYIWLVIALLGVVCVLIPDDGWHIGPLQLRFPTLAEALDLQPQSTTTTLDSLAYIDEIDTIPAIDSIARIDTITAPQIPDSAKGLESPATVAPPVQMPAEQSTLDTRRHLACFYAALDSASHMPIRIVHYGDSQIEEDRITNILREEWQKQYGGGGVGLIPLHQTIPTRSIRQWIYIDGTIQTAQGGPKRYIVYGPRSMRLTDDAYGVMGQVAVMDSTLVAGSQDIKLHIEPAGKKRLPHHYFSRVRLLTDSVNLTLLSPSINDSLALMDSIYTVQLPDSTTQCDVRLQGKGRVYGISLENPTGLIVDNIPMRGCSGNIFTKMDSMQLATFFSQTNTRLIIMQFGGNMIPQTENPSTISGYVRSTMRQQVRYLRACAPQAAILFIGPSDMSTNIDGQMTTYPLVPYMDKQLRKMAEEEQIAYWSMYEAMGGYNSMKAWHDRGLAGSDYVHFTRTGANKVGKMLYKWLMEYPNSLNTNQ